MAVSLHDLAAAGAFICFSSGLLAMSGVLMRLL